MVTAWGGRGVPKDPTAEGGPDEKKPVFTGAPGVVQVRKLSPSSFKEKGVHVIQIQGQGGVVS